MTTFQALGETRLQNLLRNGEFNQVAKLLDDLELQVETLQLPQDWPHAIHLLGHLCNYHLEDARFLWKRIPNGSKQDPQLRAAFAVLQQLWAKNYEGTWAALSAFAWQPAAAPLVAALSTHIRERTLGVLSSAYSTISVPRAAAFLGLPEAEAVAQGCALATVSLFPVPNLLHPTAPALFPANTVVQAAGWQHDAASGMLKVQWQAAEAALPSHAQHLERLTECMIDLEAGAAG